ncbi:MAG: transporter permease [Chloroflexi bacterium]|nr:transporter permease [Chloroflexota bacterium]
MIRHAARKARVLFTVWFAHMLVYRAEIIIWMLSGSIPLIMMAVWIGKASSSGGSVGGFTAATFAAYFLAVWLTNQCIVAWAAWELDRLVREGLLSPRLLRPLDPIWNELAAHVTEKVLRIPLMIAILFVGVHLVPGTQLTPDIPHVLAYTVCVGFAFGIRFLLSYCTGLLSFWTTQATAIDELYYVVAGFLTGAFAPLSLYPASVRAVIDWLPFPYIVYYPVQVLNGNLAGGGILRVLAVQALWLSVLILIRGMLWRRGLRQYGAVGA